MKRSLVGMGLAALLALQWLHGENSAMEPFKPTLQMQKKLSIEKLKAQNLNVVQKAVEGIRPTLPQKVDDYTRIVAIDSNGTRLIYTYEVDGGSKSDEALRKEGRSRMAPVVKEGICQNSRRFLEADIDIRYRYISKRTKNEILRVDVSKNDCNRAP